MKRLITLLVLSVGSSLSQAQQPWANFLTVVPSGSKNVTATAIDWTLTGLDTSDKMPPDATWTQSGSTITAASCSNGAVDCGPTIRTALAACGTNHYVLLGVGNFTISTTVTVPSNCVLKCVGTLPANRCTVTLSGNIQDGDLRLGSMGDPSAANSIGITSGSTAGSTSIVVASNPGGIFATGNLMVITETNDPAYVVTSPGNINTPSGDPGGCTYCGWLSAWGGPTGRFRSQIVEITNVASLTVTFSPPLYTDYTLTPQALPYTPSVHAGIENMYFTEPDPSVHTNRNAPIGVGQCKYCWATGNQMYFMNGDYVKFYWAFRNAVMFNYFDDGDNHGPGSDNQAVTVGAHSSGNWVVDNIFVRTENTVLYNIGSSGNVFAHNYATGNYGQPTSIVAGMESHSAHEQFNLLEGNIDPQHWLDVGHGSTSQQTSFRNWWVGTNLFCGSANTKSTVNCSSPAWAYEYPGAVRDESISTYTNFIGDVVASQALMNLSGSKFAIKKWNTAVNSGGAGGDKIGLRFGYTLQNDSGGNSFDSTTAFDTSFIHGVYNFIDGSTTWSGALTHTLPSSFYLAGKPSWWGTVPYPGIGPDITGGTVPAAMTSGPSPGGHVNCNPACNYYYTVMGGKEGGDGSPYDTFDGVAFANPPAAPPAPAAALFARGQVIITGQGSTQ